MMWISCRVLQVETSCSRKAIKAALVCRSAVLPCTLPVFTSSAAYNDRVPLRRYSKPWRSSRPGDRGSTGSKRSKRLNGGFLVHAKHSRMLRRSHVQADHVGSLVFKIRIVARPVAFQAMRTHIGLSQNALHRVLADTEATRQLTARPMGGTV